MKKLTIILITIMTIGIPFSCEENGVSNSGVYEIESFLIKAGKISEATFGYQFEEIIFDPADTDTLSASLFGMSIWIDELKFVSNESADLLNLSFINNAVADIPIPSPKSKLSAISIHSSTPVYANGMTYLSGDDLSKLFKASEYYGGEIMSIDDFAIQKNEWYPYEPIYLHFKASLDIPLAQTFQVKITMDDETVFNLPVPQIILKL